MTSSTPLPKAITIREPWVTCIARYGKAVENRDWHLPKNLYGQRVFIHVAAQPDYASSIRTAKWLAGVDDFGEFMPLGHIVGTAVFETQVLNASYLDEANKKWFSGTYGWVISDFKLLPRPIPARGQLKFWDIPAAITEELAQ